MGSLIERVKVDLAHHLRLVLQHGFAQCEDLGLLRFGFGLLGFGLLRSFALCLGLLL